jgi:hypothetical protein
MVLLRSHVLVLPIVPVVGTSSPMSVRCDVPPVLRTTRIGSTTSTSLIDVARNEKDIESRKQAQNGVTRFVSIFMEAKMTIR